MSVANGFVRDCSYATVYVIDEIIRIQDAEITSVVPGFSCYFFPFKVVLIKVRKMNCSY